MCGHIAGRDVVSHRTTVLHKYRYTTQSKNSINLYTTDLLSALTIHMLYIYIAYILQITVVCVRVRVCECVCVCACACASVSLCVC